MARTGMKPTDSGTNHVDPSLQQVFRRAGIKGYAAEVSGTLVMLLLGLVSLGKAPLIWIPVVATLVLLWCMWWLSQQQRIFLFEDRLTYQPLPWRAPGSHLPGWAVPLANIRIEVNTAPAAMRWLRPWMMSATVRYQQHSYPIPRALEWTRTTVPTDAMNQAKLAEQVRYGKDNAMDVVIEFPLLRELRARGVPVVPANAPAPAEDVHREESESAGFPGAGPLSGDSDITREQRSSGVWLKGLSGRLLLLGIIALVLLLYLFEVLR